MLIGFLPTPAPADKAIHEAELCKMGKLYLCVTEVRKESDWLVNHGNHISTNRKVRRIFFFLLTGGDVTFFIYNYIYIIYIFVLLLVSNVMHFLMFVNFY